MRVLKHIIYFVFYIYVNNSQYTTIYYISSYSLFLLKTIIAKQPYPTLYHYEPVRHWLLYGLP